MADPADDLAKELAKPDSGRTVSLPAGEIDLAGKRIDVGGSSVTLEGSPGSENFLAAIVASLTSFMENPEAVNLNLADSERQFESLIQKLLVGAPQTRIRNSQAAAVTSAQASAGLHSGLSAPKGGFSLKNLSLSGTKATARRADAATGASHVYMGLVSPDLSRLAQESGQYPGLGAVDAVAFIGNSAEGDSNVNIEGNTIFFTQRRYGPDGSFDAKNQVNALTRLASITGSLFHENQTLVAPPAAEGDTGNRAYSGAGLGWARVGIIDGSLFSRNSSQGGHHAFGGAIFASKIDKLTRSVFLGNLIASDHDAYGGAVRAEIGLLDRCVLIGNVAKGITQAFVPGTAVSGGALSGSVHIIDDAFFSWNKAVSEVSNEAEEKEAMGGAVSTNQTYLVFGSRFAQNSAEVQAPGGLALGGAMAIVAVTDTSNPRSPKLNFTEIRNSLFLNNSVSAPGGSAYGGAVAVALSGGGEYSLTLAADYGRETLFSGNTAGGAPNSLSFLGGAKAAYLYVRAESGGAVKLLDPLTVSLADGGDFNLIWEGGGIFAWAGANQITLANGAKALVDFGQSGQVILTDSFSLSPGQGSPNIEVRLSGASILLDVNSAQMKPFFQNCDFSLFEGAITARITDPSLNEASFVLAASSTGLKAISSSFTDPDSGDEYSLSLAENGQATLKRTKEGSK